MGVQEIPFYTPFLLLIFVPMVIINVKLGIGLNKRIIYALFRMTVQLVLVGFSAVYLYLTTSGLIRPMFLFMIGACGLSTVKTCGLTIKNRLIPISWFRSLILVMILFYQSICDRLDDIFDVMLYPLMGMLLGSSLSKQHHRD